MMRYWLVSVVVAFITSLAAGQAAFDAGPSYDPFAVPATVAEVEALCEQAGVSAEATAAAKALVEGCEATIRRDAARLQRAVEKAWMTKPREEQTAIQEDIEKAMAHRTTSHEAASKALLADLKAILPKDSDAAWAAFERRRHRRLYMHQSWRMGVGVDLIEVARAEMIDTIKEVREILDAYEMDLDRLLMARVPIALGYEKAMEKAGEDAAAAEKAYNELRDADCALLHVQRATGQKLIAAVPEEKRSALRDRVLTERWVYVTNKTPLRQRAEKLVKSGRLEKEKTKALEEGIKVFDDRSRAIDERHLTSAEDAECTRTYAQAMNPGEDQGDLAWYDEGRKVQAELLALIERLATEEDLDAISDE